MFDINGTYFIFIALFLGFMYLFNEIALKPVGEVIAARNKLIQDDLEAARQSKADAEEILATYQERIQASRMEGQRIIQEALQAAQLKRNEEFKRLQSEGNEKIEQIRAELAKERKTLIADLVDTEADLVQSIVRKLIGATAQVTIDRQEVQKALEAAS
jgi:F-type H+-transporting ATPase subunit b